MKRGYYLAVFTGTDHSLGFRASHTYTVQIYATSKHPVVVMVEEPNTITRCPYSSIETFLQNWDDIRKL